MHEFFDSEVCFLFCVNHDYIEIKAVECNVQFTTQQDERLIKYVGN